MGRSAHMVGDMKEVPSPVFWAEQHVQFLVAVSGISGPTEERSLEEQSVEYFDSGL